MLGAELRPEHVVTLRFVQDEEVESRQRVNVRLGRGVARPGRVEVVLRVIHAVGGHLEQAECLFRL